MNKMKRRDRNRIINLQDIPAKVLDIDENNIFLFTDSKAMKYYKFQGKFDDLLNDIKKM